MGTPLFTIQPRRLIFLIMLNWGKQTYLTESRRNESVAKSIRISFCSAQGTGQGQRGAVGELDQRDVRVRRVADGDVQHTVVHVPVRGPRRRRRRTRLGQVPQAAGGRRQRVHRDPATTGHRLHGPHGRPHGRGRHDLATHVRHPHQVRR